MVRGTLYFSSMKTTYLDIRESEHQNRNRTGHHMEKEGEKRGNNQREKVSIMMKEAYFSKRKTY